MTPLARAAKQFHSLKPVLDKYKPQRILDIGCGLALGSVLAAEYVSADYLALMDGDGTGEIFHDYREGALAWNDVAIAGTVARTRLAGCKIETFVQNVDLTIPVDLIVSWKSWGTHYPIAEYIPLAVRSLMQGGIVVTDLWPGSEDFRIGQVVEVEAAGFWLVSGGPRQHVFIKR